MDRNVGVFISSAFTPEQWSEVNADHSEYVREIIF